MYHYRDRLFVGCPGLVAHTEDEREVQHDEYAIMVGRWKIYPKPNVCHESTRDERGCSRMFDFPRHTCEGNDESTII